MAPARPRRAPEGRATLVPRRRLGMPVNAAAGCHGMPTGLHLPLLRPYSPVPCPLKTSHAAGLLLQRQQPTQRDDVELFTHVPQLAGHRGKVTVLA